MQASVIFPSRLTSALTLHIVLGLERSVIPNPGQDISDGLLALTISIETSLLEDVIYYV